MKSHILLLFMFSAAVSAEIQARQHVSPNDFKGTDTEKIQQAVNKAAQNRQTVCIGFNAERDSALWMIDEAILLPSHTSILIDDCMLKLSDSCRDNMFRSNNVGIGIEHPQWNRNIRIVGKGHAVLSGADNPRATGDGLRNLSLRPGPLYNSPGRTSYGSDASKVGRKQKSDWRNFIVLMAYVDGFTLSGVDIRFAHCWAVTCERVLHGKIHRINFYTPDFCKVGNHYVGKFNSDGIDLREGCKHFDIKDITGINGDDLIALSALDLGKQYHSEGNLNSYQITSTLHKDREADIEYVNIKNCFTNFMGVAVRASDSAQIHHVKIKNIYTHAASLLPPPEGGSLYTLIIGNDGYGKSGIRGNVHHVRAKNIYGDGKTLIKINGSIADCSFKNAVYTGLQADGPITYVHGSQLSQRIKTARLRKDSVTAEYRALQLTSPTEMKNTRFVHHFEYSVHAFPGVARRAATVHPTQRLQVSLHSYTPPTGYRYTIRQQSVNHIAIDAADTTGLSLALNHLLRSMQATGNGFTIRNCSTPLVPQYDKDFNIINHDRQANAYTFTLPSKEGQDMGLSQYQGKVLLIVNTASQCGFTPQYKELETLYEQYREQGFEILDIPCNQFGQQAPGTDEEISQFCQLNYGTKFPQFSKSDVNGENELPLYTWLKHELGFQGFNTSAPMGQKMHEFLLRQDPHYAQKSDIKWNFTKFLIDRHGHAIHRFEPTESLSEIEKAIRGLLK